MSDGMYSLTIHNSLPEITISTIYNQYIPTVSPYQYYNLYKTPPYHTCTKWYPSQKHEHLLKPSIPRKGNPVIRIYSTPRHATQVSRGLGASSTQ